MASDLLSLSLLEWQCPPAIQGMSTRPISTDDTQDLAALYLASYPPAVGARSLAEAVGEIEDSFAGTYGTLRPDACLVAVDDDVSRGAVLVVEASIWDKELVGPFIIDLFVHPDARGNGVGKTLVIGAIDACAAAGCDVISLRVGKGTSPEAHQLYESLGFTKPQPQ